MRQTGTAGGSTGAGMYLAIVCLVIAVPVLTSAWLRRDPEQERYEQARRENPEANPVADVQSRRHPSPLTCWLRAGSPCAPHR